MHFFTISIVEVILLVAELTRIVFQDFACTLRISTGDFSN